MNYCMLDGSVMIPVLRESHATVYKCPWCNSHTREEVVDDGDTQ